MYRNLLGPLKERLSNFLCTRMFQLAATVLHTNRSPRAALRQRCSQCCSLFVQRGTAIPLLSGCKAVYDDKQLIGRPNSWELTSPRGYARLRPTVLTARHVRRKYSGRLQTATDTGECDYSRAHYSSSRLRAVTLFWSHFLGERLERPLPLDELVGTILEVAEEG